MTQAVINYDVAAVRADFPALHQQIRTSPLAYLDNAATTQKPRQVLDAVNHYYEHDNANVHRGVHALSERATAAYEGARRKVAEFLGAKEREIVFVRGTTEAINLVANTFVRERVGPGDEIIVSEMEHHSNIVPWQILCEHSGAVLKVVPVTDDGQLDMAAYEALFSPVTKFVSIVHVSNALGTINPAARLVEIAHANGVPILLDGAQATAHLKVNVAELGADFYTLSGHKMYGPTGIGALYGRAEHLEAMPPYQGGGDMIRSVSFKGTQYNEIPYKFEAGTPNIAGAIGLGAAIDYLNEVGLDAIAAHEHDLLEYATEQLGRLPGLRIIGTAPHKAAVVSFVLDAVHPHDIGTLVDQHGVAIRTGHHCAQPVMERFGVPATARASFGAYNTRAEVDALVAAVKDVQEMFA